VGVGRRAADGQFAGRCCEAVPQGLKSIGGQASNVGADAPTHKVRHADCTVASRPKRGHIVTMAFAGLLAVSIGGVAARGSARGDGGLKAAEEAYEAGQYAKAEQLLQTAASAEPQNAEIQLLLTKTHLEVQQWDAAIKSAERGVALEPKSSVYHEWLGRAYGERADHASFMTALGFAKKTRKEFEMAVELDGNNFTARQAVIEYDCAAPGIAGGGEDKAQPEIAQMAALDAAEGAYAKGNCRRQKKDFATTDAEFTKALQNNLKSVERVCDIGDYAVRHEEPAMLLAVADLLAKLAPGDPRVKFYHAVAVILQKQNSAETEKLLRDYLQSAPVRSGYPRSDAAHYWLGRWFENSGNIAGARGEYEVAVKEDPKNRNAQEALKRVKKG
jgi:tetratricopeptide (TPR) repeat protein